MSIYRKALLVMGGSIIGYILAFYMNAIFSGSIVLPQAIDIGPAVIRYYGVFIALAAVIGYTVAIRRADRFGLSSKDVDYLLLWTIVGGFIGARLYHVVSEFNFYTLHPGLIVQVWNGGLSIFGAVAGGVLGLFIAKSYRLRSLRLLRLLDWLTPSIVIGQIIGRFGNMFNYELFGYPTNLPWKMFVPENFRIAPFLDQSFFHPLFLYEQICNAIILIILLLAERRRATWGKPLPQGVLFFSYVLFYTICRLFLESLRLDSVFIFDIRQNVLVSVILALISVFYLIKIYRASKAS